MSKVSRKEDQFYEMLQQLCGHVVEAAKPFSRLAKEWPESAELVPVIKEWETKCDKDVTKIADELNTSFITPFDREDLSALVQELDEIVDGMEGVAARFVLFDVGKMIPEADEMIELIVSAIGELEIVFEKLPQFKKDASIKDHARAVRKLEDTGDVCYRNALGRVFAEESADPIHVIKWKSLLDYMENTLDACKAVADIILAVRMKNA